MTKSSGFDSIYFPEIMPLGVGSWSLVPTGDSGESPLFVSTIPDVSLAMQI
ncbi:hypothetical protein ABEW05_008211 [Botrytis cinerea]